MKKQTVEKPAAHRVRVNNAAGNVAVNVNVRDGRAWVDVNLRDGPAKGRYGMWITKQGMAAIAKVLKAKAA